MPETPKTIDLALEFFVNNLTTPGWDNLMDLLADDAVIEFPFAPPNRPAKLTGKQEIVSFFAALRGHMRLDEVRIVATHRTTDPNVVILQLEGKGQNIENGRIIESKYVEFLTFRDGLVVRLQDYWNPLIGILAMGGTISFPESRA
jgi:uncharacterized protein